MKDVKDTLLERVSIRRYEREPIPQEALDLIYEAVRNTPTSYNGQQYCVIDIDDQELKEKLYAITNQKQLKTCNRLMIFCADFNKIEKLAASKNLVMPPLNENMDGIFLGVIDACLAMMSAVVAAESYGLGCNCVGYLRTADPKAVADLLKLPKGVFVVCGLAIGVPREHPDHKPKQSKELIFHHNEYRQDEELLDEMTEYDAIIKHYNQTRAGSTSDNDWVAHILDYYRNACDYRLLSYLKDQGFEPKQ